MVGGQLGGGVVDHRRRQHLGHRVDAGLDEAARGERLAEVGPQEGRPAQAADPFGPAPPHPARVVGRPLHLRELGHVLVEGPEPVVVGRQDRVVGRRASRRAPPGTRRAPSARGRAAGAVGSWARPESRLPLLRRKVIERVCSRHPSAVRRYVSVYQPMRMSWVFCSTKHSGCSPVPSSPSRVEHRRAHHEQALGRSGDERGEVGQRVGVAEGAVGAVRGEDLHDGLDVVLGHADRVPGQQLLDLDDVSDGGLLHDRTITKFSSDDNDAGSRRETVP